MPRRPRRASGGRARARTGSRSRGAWAPGAARARRGTRRSACARRRGRRRSRAIFQEALDDVLAVALDLFAQRRELVHALLRRREVRIEQLDEARKHFAVRAMARVEALELVHLLERKSEDLETLDELQPTDVLVGVHPLAALEPLHGIEEPQLLVVPDRPLGQPDVGRDLADAVSPDRRRHRRRSTMFASSRQLAVTQISVGPITKPRRSVALRSAASLVTRRHPATLARATYSASYVFAQPSSSAIRHAARPSPRGARIATGAASKRTTERFPSSREISPRQVASCSAERVSAQKSGGAISSSRPKAVKPPSARHSAKATLASMTSVSDPRAPDGWPEQGLASARPSACAAANPWAGARPPVRRAPRRHLARSRSAACRSSASAACLPESSGGRSRDSAGHASRLGERSA